ncbi:MAG: DUF4294 domain-containing protein [Flavobacteriales bacterium]|nr:DUF4294 domain-containing protein [Flavobacteriales bacterium]MCB0757029.1 DUF4294 domain-containing protein [Flavobacteriales bacterium]
MRSLSTYLFAIALAIATCSVVRAQEVDVVRVMVQGSDTMPLYMLDAVRIEAKLTGKARRNAARTDRLTRYVQKVYPYAQLTARLLDEYDHDLAGIGKKGDQELYLKLAEAELRAEFEQEIKGLTMTQGRILVKLIDRETGHTSYDIVKQLRGSFQAWMWQGIAKIFGNDLKGEYDPEGDDKLVESVVRRIENGELAVTPRAPRTEKATARLVKRKARLYRKYGVETPVVSAN